MKFNREVAVGYFIGYFMTYMTIKAIAEQDPFWFFSGAIGIGLTILIGFLGGINK